MAESKFLKFQDVDRDGLIDVCDDEIVVEEVPCKAPCIPNPSAVISDWRDRNIDVPRLNEKFCLYEVTKVTPYKTSASEYAIEESNKGNDKPAEAELREKFEEFKSEAVVSLLTYYEKLENPQTREMVANSMQFAKWDLDPRPNSRLKLLYQVPFDIIYNIPAAPPEPVEEEEDIPGRVVVTYNAGQMVSQMIRVRQGLNFYGRLLKVYRAIGEGNCYFQKSRSVFNLDIYGDSAFFDSGQLSDMMDSLEGFLDAKGYRLPGEFFGFLSGDEKVTKLKFVFDNYRLQKMSVWTQACGNKPDVFGKRRLKALRMQPAWKDRTAVAYFAQLPQMYIGLNARIQIPWTEFVEQYTYPKVYFDIKPPGEKTVGSCIEDALLNEFKDLGQDILDDAFSLGDAVAYQFRSAVCRGSIEDSQKDNYLIGTERGPDGADSTKIFAMAQEQAYKQLETSDNVFVILCAGVLASTTQFGPAKNKLSELYRFGIFRVKECGLIDLLNSALACLTSGLTADEAFSKMISAALKAMNIESFGHLFVGLPPDKQAEIERLVKQQLKDGEFGQSIGVIAKPWETQEIIDKERESTLEGPYESHITPNTSRAYQAQPTKRTERSIMEAFDAGIGEVDQIPADNVMQAYLKAIVEVYSDNLLELMDELNKFPGAQIITSIISFLDCPSPPFMTPSIADFIKDLTLPFCRNMNEFRTTRWMFENPLHYFSDFTDITKALWKLAKVLIEQLIAIIIFNIMIKICEIIGKAICKALEITGDIAASLPALMTGRANLGDIIKESICGPDADDDKIDETMIELMSQMGLGAEAYANTDTTLQFGMDLSSAVTQQEMSEALLGNPSNAFLEAADQLLEFEYPQFRESMPNKRTIGKFFSNIGNLTPLSYREKLQEFVSLDKPEVLPANPSLCASPEKIEEFRLMRAKLLDGRTTPKQAHQLFCDFREDNINDFEDLLDIANRGFTGQFVDGMPPFVSEPGCDDGIIPYESPQAASVAMQAFGGQLDSLNMAYIEDMLGNGSFWNSDSSWGFINMIMSDTMGNPLTAHHRKAFNNKSYVNFAANLKNGGESTSGFFSFFQSSAGFSSQEGQFPYYVAEWLMRQFMNAGWEVSGEEGSADNYVIKPGYYSLGSMGGDLAESLKFSSNNKYIKARTHRVDFEDLQYNNLFGSLTQGVNLFMIPDFGYNTTLSVDEGAEQVVVTREIRKGQSTGEGQAYKRSGADISLDFRDNAAGMRFGPKGPRSGMPKPGGSSDSGTKYLTSNDGNGAKSGNPFDTSTEWSYGFDVKCFYHDIYQEESGKILNRFDDNIRVEVVEKLNFGSDHIGPLGEAMEDEFTKVPAFDLPNWLENIPLVGWAIEALINLILYPFTQLIGRAIHKAALRASEKIIRAREFEFLATDDGLDVFNRVYDFDDKQAIKITDYPTFSSILRSLPSQSPPVLLLADMIGTNVSTAKTLYDDTMEALYKKFSWEIGSNKSGYLYGANYDFLTQSDIDYGIIREDGKFVPYDSYLVGGRGVREEDMILGVSRDVYNNGDSARVIYLDPKTFGGSYRKPPLYIKPQQHDGWYGYVNVLFPEYTPCKPHSQDLIDFDQLKGWVNKYYPNLPEDPRLATGSEECTREVPFNRILSRQAKIGMYVTILAAIRIYASTHIFKSIPVFSKIMPKFPDNFSNVYSAYIVERMEEDFKDAQGAFWEAFTTFKDEEFWYAFLEQSVECYDFLVEAGAIEAPTEGGHLQDAFDTINNLQTDYPFTYRPTTVRKYRRSDGKNVKQTVLGMHDLKVAGEAGWFQSLRGIRADQNLEAVQSVEEHAKLILMQLVNHELSTMGERMVKNMRRYGFNPDIFDLDYYIFQNMCAGSRLVFAGPKVVERKAGLPTPTAVMLDDGRSIGGPDPKGLGESWPGPYYTPGGEFRVAVDNDPENDFAYSDEYVGFYHGHIDEAGDVIYMVGRYHNENPDEKQDILTPVDEIVTCATEGHVRLTQLGLSEDGVGDGDDDNDTTIAEQDSPNPGSSKYDKIDKVLIDIGDVPEYGAPPPPASAATPYMLEKYISINGTKYSSRNAENIIRSAPPGSRIADNWPGTLEIVKNEFGEELGLKGQIGVRYGLQFSYVGGGGKVPITAVEIDALDVKIDQFRGLEPNSKLLMCLINHLKNDGKYKLMTSYIFSIKKVTGTLAIYSDMAFLSSIGEVTPGSGDQYSWLPTSELFAAIPGISNFIADPTKKGDWLENSPFAQVRIKPGSRAYIHRTEREESFENNAPPTLFNPFGSDDPIDITVERFHLNKSGVTGNEGWANYYDRQPGFFGGLWVCEWDNWDRILLRNSKSRIKRMFRSYYYSRSFKPGDPMLDDNDNPVKLFAKSLKGLMFPNPATGMLPWWQRGRLRSNPFNADGGLCDGKD